MFAPIVAALGSTAGSLAGAATMKLLGGGKEQDPWEYSNEMNGILQRALDKSLKTWEDYNQRAVDVFNQQYAQGRTDVNLAYGQALNFNQRSYDTARAMGTPQRVAGLNAFDKYQSMLGLATPKVGSARVEDSLYKQKRWESALQSQYGNPYQAAPNKPGAGPTLNPNAVNAQMIDDYMRSNLVSSNGHNKIGSSMTGRQYNGQYAYKDKDGNIQLLVPGQGYQNVGRYGQAEDYFLQNPAYQNQARQAVAQQLFQQQQAQYNNQQAAYNKYQNLQTQFGLTPEQQQIAQQYKSLF